MRNKFKKLAIAAVMVLSLGQSASADWRDRDGRWHRDDHRRNVVVRREYYSAPPRYYGGPGYYDPYYTYVAPAPVYVAPRPVYVAPRPVVYQSAPSTSFNFRF